LEAAKILLKYAFEEWNAHKIVGRCNEKQPIKELNGETGHGQRGDFQVKTTLA